YKCVPVDIPLVCSGMCCDSSVRSCRNEIEGLINDASDTRMCQQKTCLRSGGGFSSYQKTSISQGFHMERVMEIEPAAMQRVAAGRPIFYRLNELA
ncbi:hypothetical protein, partial [Brevibacillus sp. NL20B1]|uniref:hypothetical protein n=1 Tax=Brevibacillus sp. NL20B1 TaxID=2829799 RepID=UPI001BA36D9F